MDSPCAAADSGDGAIYFPRRRAGAAAVELAAAAALRLAPAHLLASAWTSGAVPHPLRRMERPWLSPLPYAAANQRAHGRALGAHDPRAPHELPPDLPLSLPRLSTPTHHPQDAAL